MDANGSLRRRLESAVVAGMDRADADYMQWGKDDCALWVADIVRDALAYDPAMPFRGRYHSRRGALRVLGKRGLKGAMQDGARRHKWKRINPQYAKPGDLGLVWTVAESAGWVWKIEYDDDRQRIRKRVRATVEKPILASVICRAPGWFVARNERGFTTVPAKDVAFAWCVLDDWQPGSRVNLARQITRPALIPTSAACHEPVSISLAIAAATSTFVSVAAVTAAINAVVFTALSIGVSLLVSSLQQSQSGVGALDTSLNQNTQQGAQQGAQITERQSIPYKRLIVGSAYVGGALFFEQVKPPYLTLGLLVNYGQISGIDKVFIGTNQLGFASGITPNTIISPTGVDGQPDYPNHLRMSVRYGSTTQAVDPLILDKYPSVGTEFRQRGIATAVFEYHYGGTTDTAATQAAFLKLWGQVPRPNAYMVVRGVAAYDPRDPTQSLTDETTWKWTNNATLIQAWYLIQPFGGRISKSNIRWDKIADSANYDDDLIGCNDGTMIKRHTIDGVISLNMKPFDVMRKLLTSNRAMILESAGQVWIESSRPKSAIATIHDRILVGGVKYQSRKPKENLINKLQVRFIAPEQEYQIVDGPLLDRTDFRTQDGEPLLGTLSLDYTQDHRRAQRLQKAFLLSSRLGKTITCSVDLSFMAVAEEELIGQVVTFDSTLFSKANGSYLITAVGFSDDFTALSLALTEYDPTIESDWHPETDEQEFELAAIDVS